MAQPDREPLDHVLAGLLNGAAASSIAAAVPAFFAWGALTHYDGHGQAFRLADLWARPADTVFATVLLVASVRMLMFGVGLIARNVPLLRARGAS
ncbi:MAG: hypothetical protein QM608_18900 [Caulobacter sp.]